MTLSDRERSFRRLVVANILTKLAMYFLAFGLLMLCTGGIRSFFLPTSASSRILIVIGVVTAVLGVAYTVIAIFIMRSIRTEISPSAVWAIGSVPRPSRRDLSEIRSVSRNVPAPGPSTGEHFSYSNPVLMAAEADDLKCWEPPPSYEVATKTQNPEVNTSIPNNTQSTCVSMPEERSPDNVRV